MEKIKKKTESEKAGAVRGEKASDGNLLYHEQLEEGHHVGACRFCGQMKIFDNNGPVAQEDLNEAATMTCNCDDATRVPGGRAYAGVREKENRNFVRFCRT